MNRGPSTDKSHDLQPPDVTYAQNALSAYSSPGPGSFALFLRRPLSPPYRSPLSHSCEQMNNTPASLRSCRTPSNESASSLDDSSARAGSHVNVILVILALAGCTDERGTHREPLRARFGEAVAEWMEALMCILHEGVSSAWFEIAVKNPSVTPVTRAWVAPGKSGPAVERSIPCRPSVLASCSQIPLTQTAPSNSRSATRPPHTPP